MKAKKLGLIALAGVTAVSPVIANANEIVADNGNAISASTSERMEGDYLVTEITTVEKGKFEFDTKEEADKKAEELTKDTKEQTVTAEVTENTVDTGKDEEYKKSNTYSSEEEAKKAQEDEKSRLENEGYKDIKSDISTSQRDVVTGTEEVKTGETSSTSTMDEEFESREDAAAAGKAQEKDTKEQTITSEVREENKVVGQDTWDYTNTYSSEEEAQTAKTEKKEAMEKEGYTVNTATITEGTEQGVIGTTKELDTEDTTTDTTSYTGLTESEANSKKTELESSSYSTEYKQVTVTVTISSRNVLDTEATISETKTFDSVADMNTYLSGLEASGYKVTTSKLTMLTQENTYTLSGTYNSASAAAEAVATFNRTHNTTNGSYSAVRNESKDSTSTTNVGTTRYDDKSEAQEAANALASENTSTKVEGEVITNTEDVDLKDVITRTFSSEEEAKNYIASLREEGYIIDDKDVTITKEEKTVTLSVNIDLGTNSQKITNSNRANLYIRVDGVVQYENGTTSYSTSEYRYVGDVAVSTSQFYDVDADKHQGDLAYLVDVNNNITGYIVNNNSVKDIDKKLKEYGITLKDDEVIVWYVLKNAYDYKNQEVTYYVLDADGNKIIERYDRWRNPVYKTVTKKLNQANYHIDGVIMSKKTLENIYKVTGSGEKEYYTVNTNTTSKGYDYVVSGSVNKTEENGKVSVKVDATKEKTVKDLSVSTNTKTYKDVDVIGDITVYDLVMESTKDKTEKVYKVDLTTTNRTYENKDIIEKVTDYTVSTTASKDITKTTYNVDVTTVDRTFEFVMGEGGEILDIVQTGNEVNYTLVLTSMTTAMLVASAAVTTKKKKENK